MLEIANSDAIIKGGGVAARVGRKMARELKIPIKKQASNKEHMEVDIIHANMLFEAGQKHITDKAQYDLTKSGARKGLAIYKAWLGMMANDMERLR